MWEWRDFPIPVNFWRLVVAVIFLPLGVVFLVVGGSAFVIGVFCLIVGLVCAVVLFHEWFETRAGSD